DRIHSLIAEGGDNKIAQAIKMAAAYQLVTPVSGAVVLETQQQYDENGLQPVPEGTVPTIPEPETWLLIIATLTLLSWVVYRRRKQGADEGLLA
ncbi:MAG: PEP-CTERM sorting domain-containing protein, partial [Gammaproteobacteria bacterium]|nr:PEP-CTERM sorting domain-containing protein [Gammaproteobacteria bacterium]